MSVAEMLRETQPQVAVAEPEPSITLKVAATASSPDTTS